MRLLLWFQPLLFLVFLVTHIHIFQKGISINFTSSISKDMSAYLHKKHKVSMLCKKFSDSFEVKELWATLAQLDCPFGVEEVDIGKEATGPIKRVSSRRLLCFNGFFICTVLMGKTGRFFSLLPFMYKLQRHLSTTGYLELFTNTRGGLQILWCQAGQGDSSKATFPSFSL